MTFSIKNIFNKLVLRKTDVIIFILLSLICLLPNIYFMFYGSPLSASLIKKMGFFIASIAFFIFPFFIFKIRYAFLFNGIFVILAPLEIAHIYLNKLTVGPGFIFIILQTNFHEAFEFITSYRLLLVVVLIGWIIYFTLTVIYTSKAALFSKRDRLIGLIFFVSVLFGLYVYCFSLSMKLRTNLPEMFTSSKQAYIKKFSLIYPVDLLLALKYGLESRSEMNQLSADLQNFSFGAEQKIKTNEKEIYILIIGESARYSNFSINKYERETSPELAKTKNLITFSNVYSEANLTGRSLPILLTRATAQNFYVWKKEKSVVDAFKEAGFSTYWIANQSSDDPFVKQISRRTNGEFFTLKDLDAVDNYDAGLWNYLDKVLSKKENKQFIVIQTLGSHFRYNFRYPAAFKKFTPDFEGAFDYSLVNKTNQQQHINSYDNSILYTDYFLANTIRRINQKSAISYLVYISDHGENLFENNQLFHGTVEVSRFEAHVPLFVWTSDKYNQFNSEKRKNMESNVNKKISSSVIFHSLLDLANIHTRSEIPTKSIANTKLADDSIRFTLNANMEIVSFKN